MKFFSWLFGSKDSAKQKNSKKISSSVERSQGFISYDPLLISRLKADHVALFNIFNEISAMAERGNLFKLPGLLETFKSALQAHLMDENVKFYSYVKQNMENDPKTQEFIVRVKKEMDDIAQAVIRFAKTYSKNRMTPKELARFKFELEGIGDVLIKRITLEEAKLYTFYRPPVE